MPQIKVENMTKSLIDLCIFLPKKMTFQYYNNVPGSPQGMDDLDPPKVKSGL